MAADSKRQVQKNKLISMQSIWKFFGGVPVLKGVDIDLLSGEVHALVGGNGSGKSTLMKILSGVYQKDSGKIFMEEKEQHFSSPQTAHAHGIYLVPQEPKIFPHMTILENIICGMKIKPSEISDKVASYAKDLGFDGSIFDYASSLSIANQQILEIIRGLVRNARVLIFDEPTSTLTFKEVSSFFERIRNLTSQGIGIFFISHRINEIFEISNRISVLRDGVIVFSRETSECDQHDIIRAMLPDMQEVNNYQSQNGANNLQELGREIFRVDHFSGYGFFDVSFKVYAGEVLGLAGVVGAGRTELAQAIIGLDSFCSGKVFLNGKEIKKRTPRSCLYLGLAYLPEDRHLHGIFLDMPNKYTISSSVLSQLGWPFISKTKEEKLAQSYIESLKIKATGSSQISRTLSGGNQQKVVLAKILAADPELIILDEPTRGVDAKARQDIYELIRRLKNKGKSIIFISSDISEVMQESDRILVMHAGRIETEFKKENFDIAKITASAFGIGAA